MVLRRILRFVPEPQASELVQEVFELALRHQDQFRHESSPVTWLYQIATRRGLRAVRDRERHASLLETKAPAWVRSGSGRDPESQVVLNQLWRQLDEDDVELAAYHYVDGLTQAEIGRILGCSRRTVGDRLASLRRQVQTAGEPR